MQTFKPWLWIVAGFFWIAFLPVAIVTLYSAIELQNTARAFSKSDPRLAMLQTVALKRKLDAEQALDTAEREAAKPGKTLEALDAQLLLARPASLNARNEVRFAAMKILARNGEKDPTGQCTAPQDKQIACVSQAKDDACLADWIIIRKCYDRAYGYWNNKNEKAAVEQLEVLLTKARRAGEASNNLVSEWMSADKLRKDPLYPVAESLRQPYTKSLLLAVFVMPQGILVACFTSVMAVLGAGVASLLQVYRQKATRTDALKSFLVAPLIGGLTGFMVFFVVSAGTSVLVQPSPVDSSQPISNLSAPALASLGVLAGLAAEQAIAWLQEKATAFFRSPGPKEREAQS